MQECNSLTVANELLFSQGQH